MWRKLALLAVLIAAAAAFYLLGLHRYLSLEGLQARYAELLDFYERRPALVIGAFMLLQITALALSLPGAVLSLSLAGGALFGAGWGTLIVLSSITIGDSLGFLIARYLIRDWVQSRFENQLRKVNEGVERDGAFYLLALRLMAVVPYFVVNVTMALTRLPLRVFAPISFIGLLPATALYVSAGTTLAQINSPSDIVSPSLVATFVALGLFPIFARFAFRRMQRS